MRMFSRLTFLSLFLLALPSVGKAECPFCSAVSQTLRQEMSAMDTVAIAKIIPGTVTDSDAKFTITSVLAGGDLVREKQEVTINYFGKPKENQRFLVMGVDPPELLWSSPLPISDIAVKYVESIQTLPESSLERLKFYMDYLEHDESLLAQDAYDEFANAPYSEILQLKPLMDREQLLTWIQDTSLPPNRKRLHLVMLGVCGKKKDAKLLEELMRSEDPNRRAGLDALIACFATLKGDEGLKVIDELFLKNKKSQYADTYAAIMALRFHGTEGNVLKKEKVLESMRLILDRPELADLVIPDLARWEDWTQIDKLAELFKSADEKSSWVRVPVINYLRACPLPEAAERLKELKEVDPAAYKRATSFFPMPKASSSTDSSALEDRRFRNFAVSDIPLIPARVAANQRLASATPTNDTAESIAPEIIPASGLPNRLSVISVVSMASVTLWLGMWLAISGAGNSVLLRMLPTAA